MGLALRRNRAHTSWLLAGAVPRNKAGGLVMATPNRPLLWEVMADAFIETGALAPWSDFSTMFARCKAAEPKRKSISYFISTGMEC